MILLWTIANILKLDYTLRNKIVFYAPLTENLDFMGIDPAVYNWSGTATVNYRGGAKTITGPTPNFNFTGEVPNGLFVNNPAVQLSFNHANNLNDSNTVIWFENRVPKSTPTQSNPFDSSGFWIGTGNIYVSHIAKANAVLSNSEINQIQAVLLDVPPQSLPPPIPPVANIGTFVQETPAGTRNGSNTIFTLSQNPDLNSLLIFCFGAGAMQRVTSSPQALEYTAGGTGNRTITMGLGPGTGYPFIAQYVTA